MHGVQLSTSGFFCVSCKRELPFSKTELGQGRFCCKVKLLTCQLAIRRLHSLNVDSIKTGFLKESQARQGIPKQAEGHPQAHCCGEERQWQWQWQQEEQEEALHAEGRLCAGLLASRLVCLFAVCLYVVGFFF